MKHQKKHVLLPKTATVEERFWAKVEKTGECWNWTAGLSVGYGSFWEGRKLWRAHRYSYTLAFGPIPEGLCVCHKCDNRACVRPDHLFLGTVTDNNNDKVAKGRQAKGEIYKRSSLTPDEVAELRRLYNESTTSVHELADRFGITSGMVSSIAHGRTWKHVGGKYASRKRKGNIRRSGKLTLELVREIRQRYAKGGISQSKLAQEYGIVPHTVWNIVKGYTWVDGATDPTTMLLRPPEVEAAGDVGGSESTGA